MGARDQLVDHDRCQRRISAAHQGKHPGDMGRRHGGALIKHVAEFTGRVVKQRAEHTVGETIAVAIDAGIAAGCGDVDGRAEIRIGRTLKVEADSGNGNHSRIGRRKRRRAGIVVSSRRDHDYTRRARGVDGRLDRSARPWSTKTHIDDIRLLRRQGARVIRQPGCETDSLNDIGIGTTTLTQDPQRHNLPVEGNACHPNTIIGRRCHGTRDVGSMEGTFTGARAIADIFGIAVDATAISGICAIADEVVARYKLPGEVGMRFLYSGIDNGDDGI